MPLLPSSSPLHLPLFQVAVRILRNQQHQPATPFLLQCNPAAGVCAVYCARQFMEYHTASLDVRLSAPSSLPSCPLPSSLCAPAEL